ncbi:MAG: alpha/beta fold hydrolase [Bacteroidota bacterium]
MKRLFIILFIICTGVISTAQDITGSWMGFIPAGGKNIRLVFNISKSGSSYTATMDSPDQNAFGIQCSKTTVTSDSLLIGIEILRGGYRGKWDGADQIKGMYTQNGGSIAFDLKRVAKDEIPKPAVVKYKPQTPTPPYSYNSENVLYDNLDHSVHFGATLTKPKGDGAFPAVIIITGSGTQDRDGTIGTHKTYAVLADYLTNNGIAVLRVDDRGIGETTIGNDIDKLTSAEFAKDVEAGIAYLQSRTDIDKKKIGLIGHSEGGMIAPMIAARRNDVAFIVLMAGPGILGEQIWDYQMEKNFIKPGLNAKDHQKAKQLIHTMFNTIAKSTDYNTIKTGMNDVYQTWKKQVSDTMEARLLIASGDAGFIEWASLIKAAHGLAWTNYFFTYQPAENLQKVKCPVLALNGESDVQITCKENLSAIEAALKKGNNKQYQVKILPNLNHMFQTCKTPADNYETIEETFAPSALQIICNWIKEQTQ